MNPGLASSTAKVAIALLLLASVMFLALYLDQSPQSPIPLDFLLGIFFYREPQGVMVRAPSMLNISRANAVVAWGYLAGLATLALLSSVRRPLAFDRDNQARGAVIIVCLLTLICLSMLAPRLARTWYYGFVI